MGQLYAITPFTQLDFPDELACIAWFSGCNLRCVYCHNPDIVSERGRKENSELISFLALRRGRLTGVVFSGGEATFCPDLPDLARQAKTMGYKTKLDTNGTHPEALRQLVESRLIDSFALDYKCPPHRSEALLGTTRYDAVFQESLTYLIQEHNRGNVMLEIRTTCPTEFIDETDIAWIIDDLDRHAYRGTYWLQHIVTTGENTLGNISPSRVLDRKKLPQPKNFKLGFRNFPPPERV
jgi:pyruvate formate lyase activating enzyme